MGGLQVFVFPNAKKERQKQPHARIVIAQRELKKEGRLAGGEMFDGDTPAGGEGY